VTLVKRCVCVIRSHFGMVRRIRVIYVQGYRPRFKYAPQHNLVFLTLP